MEKLAKSFKTIVEKYGLNDEKKADAVAHYVTSKDTKHFSLKDFCDEFNMEPKDAELFLEFIYKGIEFREQNLMNANDLEKKSS